MKEEADQTLRSTDRLLSFPLLLLLTWYSGDGDLPAAVAIAALSEGLDLDYVVLVGGQRQLHRGGVGLHDAGVAMPILLVQHLQGWGEVDRHLGVRQCSCSLDLDLLLEMSIAMIPRGVLASD